MRVNLGAGWYIHHVTDRVIELRKDDYTARRFLGRDLYVKLRAEPGMGRGTLVEKAKEAAQQQDAMLAERVAKKIMPRHVTRFREQQRQFAQAFGIPGEEPEQRRYAP